MCPGMQQAKRQRASDLSLCYQPETSYKLYEPQQAGEYFYWPISAWGEFPAD